MSPCGGIIETTSNKATVGLDACTKVCHPVGVAMFAWGGNASRRVGYVHLVQGRIQLIPWGRHTLSVPTEYCIIGEPAAATKLASLTDNEAKIGQHVSHPLRVCLGDNSNIGCKQRHPCSQSPIATNLSLPGGFGWGQSLWQGCQPLCQRNDVGQQLPHVHKLQRLDALHQSGRNGSDAVCDLEGRGFGFQAGGGAREEIGAELVDVSACNEEAPRAALPGELVAGPGKRGIVGRDRGRGVAASTGPSTGDNSAVFSTRSLPSLQRGQT